MARESLLLKLQQASGAEIVERDNWFLAARFGDPLEEYRAVQTGVGVFDLCGRNFLRFTGADRVSFLNGMVPNDIKALSPSQGLYAAFLDIHGKILADARVFCTEQALLVDLPELCKEQILQHLERHLVADEVEIQDLSADWTMISLQGPAAANLAREAVSISALPDSELAHATGAIGSCNIFLIRVMHAPQDGYDLVLPCSEAIEAVRRLQEIGKKFGLCWVGANAYEMLRIEAGIPRYGVDMNADNLLLETGLEHAVSYTKGCYLGQEIIERIHSRGHVNKQLAGLILGGRVPVERGSAILYAGREVGKITSSVFSPYKDSAIALGYVQREACNPGESVVVRDRTKEITAALAALPIYPATA